LSDRLILVPYRRLTENPAETINEVEASLGLLPQAYDFKNIRQITNEDNTVHGLSLHTIRQEVAPPDVIPWEGILPETLADSINNAYPLIQRLANSI
jgi:hypothetical protein